MEGRVLLVEGLDDKHVVWALLAAHAVPQVFTVVDVGNDLQLLDELPVRLKAGVERLAVILDADTDLNARWAQLQARLTAGGCVSVLNQPAPDGTVVHTAAGQRVGVWLMPDNQLPGILEHFLAFLVPDGDQLLPLVDSFLNGLPRPRRFPDGREAKARMHAWLAIQSEPGKPMGQAVTARYLDAQRPVVAPFLAWLRATLVDA